LLLNRGKGTGMAAALRSDALRVTTPLADALEAALAAGDDDQLDAALEIHPVGRRDAALALAQVHDLHLAPVPSLGDRVRFQHHPAMATLKHRLERAFLGRLPAPVSTVDDAVAGMRKVAAVDLVPPVYDWVADEATLDEVRAYLTLEGGPDGGFDDLVAVCQIGIEGEPKVELATNYWDEMGRGSLDEVHTELHRQMVEALGLVAVDRRDQPVEALERSLLGSTLATNRALQPELVGALGLLELQAGPRCRRVVKGLERLGCSGDALAFYEEHAVADPRHGKDWLDHVVGPLAERFPDWAPRIVTGAAWRSHVNAAFFAMAAARQPGRAGDRVPAQRSA
jgi:hypothetical protein